MLEISIPRVIFNEKLLLKNVLLRANINSITVITGESGSGKSTIIDILTLRRKNFSSYKIFESYLNDFSDDQLQNYIYNYIGIVYQKNELIDHLTVSEHIQLIKNISKVSKSVDEEIDILELNELLNKYPSELSGGERVRTCILLSLIKNPQIIILDEPTSSLDEYYTDRVLQILKKWRKERIVIVASHDKKIMDMGDRVYRIKNKTIEIIKDNNSLNNKESFLEKKQYNPEIRTTKKFFKIFNKHNKIYRKVIFILTVFCIGLTGFSIAFNNIATYSQLDNINDMASNELIIYKPSGGFSENRGVENGEANNIIFPEEIDKIKKLPYIEDVQWRLDLWRGGFISLADSPLYYNPKSKDSKSLYGITVLLAGGKKIQNNDKELMNSTLNTYLRNHSYENEVAYDFGVKGIYISKKIALSFVDNIELLKGATVSFNLPVPIYNSDGKARGTLENGETYNQNLISCEWVPVELPIAGILNTSSMGITNYFEYALYIEQSEMKNYINQYKAKKNRIVYLYGDELDLCKVSIDEEPSTGEIFSVVKDEIWTPKNYSVFISDITKVDEVVKEINSMGFNVSNQYFETSLVIDSVDYIHTLIKYITLSMTFIILLGYVIIKVTNRYEQENINKYLFYLGLTKQNLLSLKSSIFLNNFLVLCSLSTMFLILVLGVANYVLKIGYTSLELSMFLYIIIVSFFIEYILPIIIEKKLLKRLGMSDDK